MLKKLSYLILGCFVFSSPLFAGFDRNQVNKPSAPSTDQLRQYYTSGEYFKEIEKKLVDARAYLDQQLQADNHIPLAIVLDIDETALSNYHSLERMQFTQNMQAITGSYMLGNSEPIPPVLALYQYAIENKVAVFFVASRPNSPEIMNVTAKNLKAAGYTEWQELILKPLDNSNESIQAFKEKTRKHIVAQGYDIVLNIGDQEADVHGGYALAKVRLPNPFYTYS